MRRRQFIALFAGMAVSRPLTARAQPTSRQVRRIGILMPYVRGDAEIEARVAAFRGELQRLGWAEGSNVQFDERWTTDNMDMVRANAASLVNANPDAIVAIGGRVIPILMQMTHTVPIVIPGASDPVGAGYVANLAHPGGNVTGFAMFELSVLGKMLEVLKQIAPATSRVVLIFNPDNPNAALYRRLFESSAPSLAVEPIIAPIHGLADIERIIASLAERPNGGVFLAPDITITALRTDIIALVERYRMPAVYPDAIFVQSGGLASYSADRTDIFRRTAGYVDRILRGDKPGDLPFEQPNKYQLMFNLKTAKALGLTVPQALLVAADEVIE
jgi:putative ABC transport system substrate-binding protein